MLECGNEIVCLFVGQGKEGISRLDNKRVGKETIVK